MVITKTREHHAWDIYAEQLFSLGYGYPMWVPDVDPALAEVEIGDVGWIEEGQFLQLFNATRSPEDRQIRGRVPSDFEQLDPTCLLIIGPHQHITQRFISSRTIEKINASGDIFAG